ncbi:hypothetical protein HMI54_003288 [Coelomomyces lativittatus]|nr:hypothetical protein HMI56_000436 [Coelomomyces lativittatus]KAJ1508343.1 hypothetical protein HMI54_003288 [Coelomomyces lativittatus]
MKHMSVHMRLHQVQVSVTPKCFLCSNRMCGNEGQLTNELHLCATCFRPFLQASAHNVLKKKVHRYFHQFTSGCGQIWCCNKYCKSSALFEHSGLDATGSALLSVELAKSSDSWYCVSSHRLQLRREIAEEMASIYLVPLVTSMNALLKYENEVWFGNENEDEVDEGKVEDVLKIKLRWASLAANHLLENKK